MSKSQQILQEIADRTRLEPGTFPGMPVVEIAGYRRILIERHNGITGYNDTEIHVQVPFGKIQIYGQKLVITAMSRNSIAISGIIDGIRLLRSGQHG